MAPETRTWLRRIIACLAGWGHAVLAYSLHHFEGWAHTGMMCVDLILFFIVVRLCISEGRARERADQEKQR